MHYFRGRNRLIVAGLALAAMSGSNLGAAASTATISGTASQTIKGWGCFPSYFRSDWGTDFTIFNRPAIQDAIYAMGITHIRVDVEPRLYVSGTTVSNMVLDSTAVSDLTQQIQIARNHGVTQYITTCYSPPAPWKDGGTIDGGHLAAADEPYYVAFYTKVLQTLNANGVGLPVMVSVANEPDMNSTSYDTCIYSDTPANMTLWAKVVKDMRASFDANGLSAVKIGGPESTSLDDDTNMLGGAGLPLLGTDPALNSAMTYYASHGYSECWFTGIKQGQATYPKDSWIMEWSAINSGTTDELTRAIYATRHMTSNLVDMQENYWTWWRCWIKSASAPGDEELLTGDTAPTYSKRYWIFKQLWNTVRPGWVLKKMTCDNGSFITSNSVDPGYQGHSCDTFVDMAAFEPANGTTSAVILSNPTASAVSMTVNGLNGTSQTTYQTDSSHDMANVGSGTVSGGSATVTLPSNSVTIVVTMAGTPTAPTGLSATAGNTQVSLSWNASGGATAYDIKRSTVSGSGYATISSPATTSYTNTGLTNGTTYYFVVDAKNASGASGNSGQVSSVPTTSTGAAFITGQTLGATTRNNWTGGVGIQFTVGSSPVTVTDLGRWIVSGNSGTHTVKLVTASNGVDVANGSVSIATSGATAGAYKYVTLGTAVTLSANTSYYLVTMETSGGDSWYNDDTTVTSSGAGTVNAAVYSDTTYHINLSGSCAYGPVNFKYSSGGAVPPAPTGLTATPANGRVSLTWNASSSATSYNVMRSTVNGSGYATVASPTTTSYANTGLTNGTTYYFVVSATNASGSSGNSGQASAVPAAMLFITGQTLGASTRNNWTGGVGIQFTVGGSPVTVTDLGRWIVSGNSGTHTVKLVTASNGVDVANGSVSIATSGATAGAYKYVTLGTAVTLSANTSYYLVTMETSGGDSWYNDDTTVTSSGAGTVNAAVYSDTTYHINLSGSVAYGPVNFKY